MPPRRSAVRYTWFADREAYMLQWRDPITNRVRSKSAKTDSETVAAKLAKELEQELAAGRTPRDATWADARTRYEAEHVANLSRGHKAKVAAALGRAERDVGCHRCSAIPLADWRAYVSGMSDIAPATAAGHVRVLRHFFKWLDAVGWLDRVPVVPMPKFSGEARGRPLSRDEVPIFRDAFAKECPEHTDAWLRLFDGLRLSGLRLSEALSLSWEPRAANRVEWHDGAAFLRIQVQKSARRELCPTIPAFEKLLKQTAVWDRKGYVFLPWLKRSANTKCYLSRKFSRAGAAAGIETAPGVTATAHDLRRTFAMHVLEIPGINTAEAQRLTRHKEVTVLLKYYAVADGAALSKKLRAKRK